MMFQEYEVVRLHRPLPEHNLPMGVIGTVVIVYEGPLAAKDDPLAYEVEFCDADGVTIALVTLHDADLERLPQ